MAGVRLVGCESDMEDMVGLMAVAEEAWRLLPSELNPFTKKQCVGVHMMFAQDFEESGELISMKAELSRMWAALHDLERWLYAIKKVNDRLRDVFGVLRTNGDGHHENWFEMTKKPKLFDAAYKQIMGEFKQGLLEDDHRSLVGNALLTCAFVHGLNFGDIRRLKQLMLAHGLNDKDFPLDDFWNPCENKSKMALSSHDTAMRMVWKLKSDLGKQIQKLQVGGKSQHEQEGLEKLQAGQEQLHKRLMADDSFFDPTDDIVSEVLVMAMEQQTRLVELLEHMRKQRMF